MSLFFFSFKASKSFIGEVQVHSKREEWADAAGNMPKTLYLVIFYWLSSFFTQFSPNFGGSSLTMLNAHAWEPGINMNPI